MALHRCDYDKAQDAFIIGELSNNELVEYTKTKTTLDPLSQ